MREEEGAGRWGAGEREDIHKGSRKIVVYTWMRKPRLFFSKEALSNILLVFHTDNWPSLPLINLTWGL